MPWTLFLVLVFCTLTRTIYSTARTHWIGDLPDDYGFNIASQLDWVNCGLEVISEFCVLPLFYALGLTVKDRAKTANKMLTATCVVATVYVVVLTVLAVLAR